MTSPGVVTPTWSVVVPLKPVAVGKSRLTGVAPQIRSDLARGFALDTVSAALGAGAVLRVVVVTNDPESDAFRAIGAEVLADRPDAGLNSALVHATRHLRARDPAAAVLTIAGDLPSLRSKDVSDLLVGTGSPYWFVSDAHGTGTTMLAAATGQRLSPAFGPHSRAAHRAQGAEEVTHADARAHRDVDTLVDLRDALRLGVGEHTAAVVSQLPPDALR